MKKLSFLAIALATLGLGACADYRFVGFDKCSADGSVVWFERANAQGSYEGLNNTAANCRR